MNIPDYYNLLDYSKTLYKSNRDGKPYCRVGVSLNDGELTVWRFDFEEWEYNRRTGVVESSYSLDLVNTRQFCSSLKTYSSVAVVKEMKKRFGNRVGYYEFIDNFKQFCDKNEIEYNYNVWY